MRRDFCLTFLQRLSYYTLLSLREKTNYKIVVKVVHSWRLDSARKGRKGGATRSGKGFRRSVFVVVLFYSSSRRSRRRRRSARACFPLMRALMSSRCVSHRIIIIVSLERGVSSPQRECLFVFSFFFFGGLRVREKATKATRDAFAFERRFFVVVFYYVVFFGGLFYHRDDAMATRLAFERRLDSRRSSSFQQKRIASSSSSSNDNNENTTVHVDGGGPVGMQRRSRGLLGVSASQKRVSTRELDPSGSGQTTRGRSDEDMGQDRETRQRYELGRGEERRRRREGVVEHASSSL